jgi:ribosomal protein S12 methylthiotransferase
LIKFFLDQHGCAKNQVDGEALIARLRGRGYERAAEAADADVIIVNTCGFIESAKKESLEAVFGAKKMYPGAKIIAAGCLAERYAEEFSHGLPEADGIFGVDAHERLAKKMERVLAGERVVMCRDAPNNAQPAEQKNKAEFVRRDELLSLPGTAYVKISEGCGNFCSFCAIPRIRGALRSRSVQSITRETEELLARGVFEINLIAQDSSCYGRDFAPSSEQSPLVLLLNSILRVKKDFWLRLLYLHPDHFPLDILPIIKNDSRVLPYFDIPFQSGSGAIIKAMNRKGSAAQYEALMQTIRSAVFPRRAVFRTTLLSGFPGETEEDARFTEEFLRRVEADWAGVFEFSREEGTSAFAMKGQVPKKTAATRARGLKSIQEEITRKKLESYIGTTQSVLVEEVFEDKDGGTNENFAIARAWFQAPEVDGSCVIRYDEAKRLRAGEIVQALITGSRSCDLTGEFA